MKDRIERIMDFVVVLWIVMWVLGFALFCFNDDAKSVVTPRYDTIESYICFNDAYPKCTPRIYQSIIKHCENNKPIKPEWVLALIYEESRFNQFAVSNKGAQGLCQLMPDTARQVGVLDPFNADENIRGGVEYLNYCLKRSGGNLREAFMRYHAGPNAKRFLQKTIDYADRCMVRIHDIKRHMTNCQ